MYVMFGLPEATPVTAPVVEFTVASAVLLLLHVPPAVGLVKVVVLLTQKGTLLVIGAGTTTFTETCACAVQVR